MAEQTFDAFFSQTINTSTMTATLLTPPRTDAVPTTIKMEQLEVFDPSSPQDYQSMSEPSSTPAPSGSSDSKSVKKRKSWGQVLPEPKTSLPPRKRAKTEDEKEQRRIERVKRNRLAAHNSRERKRQEYELLQDEKDRMEADLTAYQQKLARMEAELKFYRSKYPGEAPSTVFDLSPSTSDSFDTICPARTSTSFPSPISMDSMDSPRDSSCQPETPASTFEASPDFDSTQYPAAVLCDLQCQSISGMASPSLVATLTYLTLFNITIQSTKSLLSSTISSTLTSSQKAAQQLLQWNPLLAWLMLNQSTSSAQPSSAPAPSQPLMAFLMALMQSSLICRVPLAQLMLATRLSQQSFSIEDIVATPNKGMSEAGSVDGVLGTRLMRSGELRQMVRRKDLRSWGSTTMGQENLGCGITRRLQEL